MVEMPNHDISTNLAELKPHIQQLAVRSGRSPDEITLVAVSKTRTFDEVKQAVEAGQKHFGENTMQDALSKIPLLIGTDTQWHFIGHLQSKKARYMPGNFHWIHSVDSLKLAKKLSHAMAHSTTVSQLNCLIQVNVAEEASKSGLNRSEALPFIDQLLTLELPHLSWRGLMTIGIQGDDSQTRSAFAGLRCLLGQCQQEFALADFNQLSMGMSNDYPIAIEEGSTMLRIGTAIFGRRKGLV
jgi:pyridoxal phosphate enzyme (YggS family)